jgi:hypothetical protein
MGTGAFFRFAKLVTFRTVESLFGLLTQFRDFLPVFLDEFAFLGVEAAARGVVALAVDILVFGARMGFRLVQARFWLGCLGRLMSPLMGCRGRRGRGLPGRQRANVSSGNAKGAVLVAAWRCLGRPTCGKAA